MAIHGEILFSSLRGQAHLSDVLRHNLESEVPAKVASLSQHLFSQDSDDDLAKRIEGECRAIALELDLDNSDAEVTEVRHEVRDMFGDFARVPGLNVLKLVPFKGERDLFFLRPNTFDLNPPYGEIRSGRLVVGMQVRESEGDRAEQHIKETLSAVQENIDHQKPQIEEYNHSLPGVALAAVQKRRASLGTASDLADRLRGR